MAIERKADNSRKKGAVYTLVCVGIALLLALIGYFAANRPAERVYKIETSVEAASTLESTLYIATKSLPDEARKELRLLGFNTDMMGAAMPVFAYQGSGSESSSGTIYWFPAVSSQAITGFYIVTDDPVSVGYSSACAEKIQALADKTSFDAPMYIAADDVNIYAVIGDTAYYIGDIGMQGDMDYLPEIIIPPGDTEQVAEINAEE